ncbi:hypothetical protein [Luteibacter aegosomatissinici]|uniref:hypothetical protein n=1 Tax=Luteibacter aegosomatissinici TaxID=2911539 RepID=UPI001FF839E8|nr:hypothetical protein [Luteibacter aegosomatissinici]UPG92815.1 hypothetical protein L2Y97_13165 [Luteibacter aegosomatissinici]
MEWSTPPQDEEVRQGDILMERPPRGGQPAAMSIVVTADCDIAQRKFGTHLACLRLVWYPDYVRNTWAESERLKLLKAYGERLGARLRALHSAQLGQDSTLSDAAALDWLRREDMHAILDALDVPEGSHAGFTREFGPIQAGLRAEMDQPDAFERCLALRSSVKAESRATAIAALLEKAGGQSKFPDDVFFLPGLPGYDVSPAVVLLRELVATNTEHVVHASSDAVASHHRVRVGRLIAPYKYALTQAFGNLYSRIGMPTEYEVRRDSGKASILECGWI